MLVIDNFTVSNFKSFKKLSLQKIDKLTVLIGSNGVGKSNFLSILNFIGESVVYGLESHLRRKKTELKNYIHHWDLQNKLQFQIRFFDTTKEVYYNYYINLEYVDGERFIISKETFHIESTNTMINYHKPSGNKVLLKEHMNNSEEENKVFEFLSNIRVYNFYHNTLLDNKVSIASIDDTNFLKEDLSNFASIVLNIKIKDPLIYNLIISTIKQTINTFIDFAFDIKDDQVYLSCKISLSKSPVTLLSLSEGTIRYLVLVVLLNMPDSKRPSLMLLEEPEISLHPHAIEIVADLIDSYSQDTQLIIATQSPHLLSKLNIQRVYVLRVDQEEASTIIKRIELKDITHLLEKYSLGDLWIMNLLGGTPLD